MIAERGWGLALYHQHGRSLAEDARNSRQMVSTQCTQCTRQAFPGTQGKGALPPAPIQTAIKTAPAPGIITR